MNIRAKLTYIAKEILAYEYKYDPKHEKRPEGSDWKETEKGWQKGKSSPVKTTENKFPGLTPEEVNKKIDLTYSKAVAKGNLKIVQKIVNAVARKKGYSIKALHGTSEKFTYFDPTKRDSYTSTYGAGMFFFTDNEELAEEYASMGTAEFKRLNAERINASDRWEQLTTKLFPSIALDTMSRGVGSTIANEQLEDGYVTREEYDLWNKVQDELTEATNKAIEAKNKQYEPITLKVVLKIQKPIVEKIGSGPFFGSWNYHLPRMVEEMKAKNGDGVIAQGVYDSPFGSEIKSTVYAVTNPSQIKSSEPITKDDDGNIIPLSKRFNSESKDIRF